MIDWLTLVCPGEIVSPEVRDQLTREVGMVMKVDATGEISWMKPERKSVRSDSHQLTVEMGADLRVYGSPARVGLIRTDNVFGSGDIEECARRMINFVRNVERVELPHYKRWKLKKLDITHNYDLGNLTNVKTALEMLRHVQGDRYQVNTSAESVYWSKNSTVRSGKAYAKGPHLRHLKKKGTAGVSDQEIEACDRLLRLELQLRRHFWDRLERDWWTVTESELDRYHSDYFGRLVGDVVIDEKTDMEKACIAAAIRLGMTEGYGKAAAMAWCVIRSEGFQFWQDKTPRSTMFKHKKILREAGLSYADFAARNVVPIRRRRVILNAPVKSWGELMKTA
ncbi:hypothetical protein F3N42_07255 [Marinihelvus fidelis]|uniref:Replication-associated protein G2P N-terminal domain-containing protein n=1 Tax=Marinihelvus fidelis TaxID=2613842 RepID=A0A5N0TA83_9GAMM|nr:phage/plasmid replication protein, II/X family [Marinihelvus fidelis]KAA9131963.1 hypothetical protein F3N42_07255 [Marinihelvus fidelis]